MANYTFAPAGLKMMRSGVQQLSHPDYPSGGLLEER
jgi:hypothetical protein